MLAGAALAGIAGFLKGTVGAHEVITTIMLNWIVVWVGSYLFGVGGPLQTNSGAAAGAVPSSDDIPEKAHLHTFWGDPLLQGLHIGFFVALAALVVYSLMLNRTTLGYEVRAVGHNPEAARYGGINVARNYFLAMAIAGAVRRPRRRLSTSSAGSTASTSRRSRARTSASSASPSRCSAGTRRVGVGLSALLFAALQTGTASRNLDPTIFAPGSASSLAVIIQGLVVLFVGADLLILILLGWLRRGRRRPKTVARMTWRIPWGSRAARLRRRSPSASARRSSRCRPSAREARRFPIAIGLLAIALGLAFWLIRGERRIGGYAIAAGVARAADRLLRDALEHDEARHRRRLGRALRGDAALRDAARVRRARRPLLGALGRREHRPRGDDAHGRVLRRLGLGRHRLLGARAR